MKLIISISFLSKLLILQYLSIQCLSDNFDFFLFVQQWPGAYCDSRQSCCYPKTGKPKADFSIHGLWPNNIDGSWPSNCNPDSTFDKSQISDLIKNMEKNWPSLSCPSSVALKLKEKVNLLQILKNAGIEPNDEFYSIDNISKAIKEATGFTPEIACNRDSARNSQIFQVYMCVDTSGSSFIECPRLPKNRCGGQVQFSKF
ncbi:ribonuclease T2 [Trifolium repens]|nr:ribonuclease T2 [Trifolium repens]